MAMRALGSMPDPNRRIMGSIARRQRKSEPTRQRKSSGSTKQSQPVSSYVPRGTGGKTPPRVTSGGSGGKVSATKPVAPAIPGPVKPIVPDINAYLAGDVDYQGQLRQFDKTLGDFNANLGNRRTRLTADYGQGKRDMEKQKIEDLLAIKDDFASRGILGSGLYTGRIGEYETSFADQLANFERTYNDSLGDLTTESTQFLREQELQKEASRQDAIRRRAQQYGL